MISQSYTKKFHSNKNSIRAFTIAEMLIIIFLSAVVMTASYYSYRAIIASLNLKNNFLFYEFKTDTEFKQLYGNGVVPSSGAPSQKTMKVSIAPSKMDSDKMLKIYNEIFIDTLASVAIFGFKRNVTSNDAYRVNQFTISDPKNPPLLDTAEKFRDEFLSTSGFTVFQQPDEEITRASIYFLGNSDTAGIIPVISILEIDSIDYKSNEIEGTLVSVRLFKNTKLVNSYEVFYKKRDASLPAPYPEHKFSPIFVEFNRKVTRNASDASSSAYNMKLANLKPFYIIFLPNPSAPYLEKIDNPASNSATTNARYYYNHMSYLSSMQLVLPMFPGI